MQKSADRLSRQWDVTKVTAEIPSLSVEVSASSSKVSLSSVRVSYELQC
jgi:hypothetical protein